MDDNRWSCGNLVVLFKRKANDLMAELIKWSQVIFWGRERKLEGLLKELKIFRESNEHYVSGEGIKLIERQIDEMLIEEEIY